MVSFFNLLRPALLLVAAGAGGAAALADGFAWLAPVAAVIALGEFVFLLLDARARRQAEAEAAARAEADAQERAEAERATRERIAAAEAEAERRGKLANDSLQALAGRLSNGDLAARIGGAEGLDPAVTGQLDKALLEINTAVDEALALADVASAGDLSARASGAYHGHCAALTRAMNGLLDSLAGIVSTMRESVADNSARGVEMHTVATAMLDQSQRQATSLASLDAGMRAIEDGLRHAADLAGQGRGAASDAVAAAEEGRARIDAAKATMNDILKASEEINGVLEMIDLISQQTTLLSVNAGVEAARAGAAGRGFAVVTEEIGNLALRTTKASQTISEIIARANGHVARGSAMVEECETSIVAIVKAAAVADDRAAQIGDACEEELTRFQEANAEVSATRSAAETNLELAARADAVAEALETSARELDATVGRFRLSDREMAEAVKARAASLSKALDQAVDRGEITMEALFSDAYEPIPGSNPQQHMTPFVPITDRLFPPVLESVYELGDGVAFAAAVNTDGFLPTHNRKFSQRPGSDPVWNAANCRNRRFFDDRVGLAAGRNRADHTLQVYRRDMGGGSYVTMKDISAPITVKGRHWGGLRIGYRSAEASLDKTETRSVPAAPRARASSGG